MAGADRRLPLPGIVSDTQNPRQPLVHVLNTGLVPRLALVGAGGKTSLLFALAHALARPPAESSGVAVLCLTTTHIRPPHPDQCHRVLLADSCTDALAFQRELAVCLLPGQVVVVAARHLPAHNKLKGLDPRLVDELARLFPDVPLLIEADGAAGYSLKAPAEHEPVIPDCVNHVVGVAGLDAALEPLQRVGQRWERIAGCTGLEAGDVVTPGALARLAAHPEGMFKGAPQGSERCVFCNKADLPGGVEFARGAAQGGEIGVGWFAGSVQQGWCVRLAG